MQLSKLKRAVLFQDATTPIHMNQAMLSIIRSYTLISITWFHVFNCLLHKLKVIYNAKQMTMEELHSYLDFVLFCIITWYTARQANKYVLFIFPVVYYIIIIGTRQQWWGSGLGGGYGGHLVRWSVYTCPVEKTPFLTLWDTILTAL